MITVDAIPNFVRKFVILTAFPPPQMIGVSSTGDAARRRSYCMGIYQLSPLKFNDRPVWKHTHDEMYLFQNAVTHHWVISFEVGSASCSIQSSSGNYPSPVVEYARWKYYDGGWKVDDSLSIKPVTRGG